MSNPAPAATPIVMTSVQHNVLDAFIKEIRDWDDRRYELKLNIAECFALDEHGDVLPEDIEAVFDLMTGIVESVNRILDILELRRDTAVICDDGDDGDEGCDHLAENQAHDARLERWMATNANLSTPSTDGIRASAGLPDQPAEVDALKLDFVGTLANAGITPAELPCMLLSSTLYDLTDAISDIRLYCADLDRQGVPPELMTDLRHNLGGIVSIGSGFAPLRAQAAISRIQKAVRRSASA
jgi:hypothetical protein